MASTANVKYGSDFYIPYFLMAHDIVRDPPRFDAGYVYVPNGPGLGVELDEAAVQRVRVA